MHAILQRVLLTRLEQFASTQRLGHAFPEQRIVLGGGTRVPDVSFYRQSRLPLDEAGDWIAHPTTPPDIVAEIYSPGQEARPELTLKAAWYVEQGVGLVLLVDPERQRVTAFAKDGEEVFADEQPLPLEEYLPGLRITPGELFGALRP